MNIYQAHINTIIYHILSNNVVAVRPQGDWCGQFMRARVPVQVAAADGSTGMPLPTPQCTIWGCQNQN